MLLRLGDAARLRPVPLPALMFNKHQLPPRLVPDCVIHRARSSCSGREAEARDVSQHSAGSVNMQLALRHSNDQSCAGLSRRVWQRAMRALLRALTCSKALVRIRVLIIDPTKLLVSVLHW